jgi:hypothetical protein
MINLPKYYFNIFMLLALLLIPLLNGTFTEFCKK